MRSLAERRRLVEGVFKTWFDGWLEKVTGLKSPRVAQFDEGVLEVFWEGTGSLPGPALESTVGGTTGAMVRAVVRNMESGSSSDESESNMSSYMSTTAGGWIFMGAVVDVGVGWFLGGLSDRNMSSGGEKRGDASRLARRGTRVPVRRTPRRRIGRRGVRGASWSELGRRPTDEPTGGAGAATVGA